MCRDDGFLHTLDRSEVPTFLCVGGEAMPDPSNLSSFTSDPAPVAISPASQKSTDVTSEPELPSQRVTKSKLRRIITVVIVAVIAVGGGTYAIYAHFYQRGASSPEAVIDSISRAIPSKDITTVFKMLSPGEVDTISESADAVKNAGSGKSKSKVGGRSAGPDSLFSAEAINQYLDAISVTSSTMTYDVDHKSDDLAVVKISSWKLNVDVGQNLASTLRTRYQKFKGSSLSRDEGRYFDDLDFSGAKFKGDVAKSLSDSFPLEIVVVRESGRWYASPLMTLAQWSYQNRVKLNSEIDAPDYLANFSEAEGAKTAQQAVEQLTEAVLSARRPSDLLKPEVTNLIALPERRLAMVYGPTLIDDDSRYSEPLSRRVRIDWSLESSDIGDSRTVVRPGNSKIVLDSGDENNEVTLELKGGEVDVTTSADQNNTGSADFARELANPERLGVVVDSVEGTWHVSTSKTIVNIFSLKPSKGALDGLSRTLSDLGVDSDDANDLSEAITSSVAVAVPVLVVADVADQLQGLEWRRDHYASVSNDMYFSQCDDGDMEACDALYLASPSGTYAESFGKRCGDRDYAMTYGGQCKSTYGRRY